MLIKSSFWIFVLFSNKKLEESQLREINFLYESFKILYDVCSEFLDCSDIKFNQPMLLPTAIKLHKENEIKKCTLFESAKKKFYEYCNGISNLQSDYFHYCSCENFEGCEKRLGYKEYCFICWIWNSYCAWDFD